jgi:hypothetical protein
MVHCSISRVSLAAMVDKKQQATAFTTTTASSSLPSVLNNESGQGKKRQEKKLCLKLVIQVSRLSSTKRNEMKNMIQVMAVSNEVSISEPILMSAQDYVENVLKLSNFVPSMDDNRRTIIQRDYSVLCARVGICNLTHRSPKE